MAEPGIEHAPIEIVAAVAQTMRIERREAPILPARIVAVGRSAEADAVDEQIAKGPTVAAITRGSNGKILVDADRHALRGGASGDTRELFVEGELQIRMKLDRLSVRLAKTDNRRGVDAPIGHRPALPIG